MWLAFFLEWAVLRRRRAVGDFVRINDGWISADTLHPCQGFAQGMPAAGIASADDEATGVSRPELPVLMHVSR